MISAETSEGRIGRDVESRIVRYEALRPCLNAFIDTRSPGSDRKENFTIIGPGVSENPNQHVHISEPHGFNIGGARQPPGCLNSQHSHDTAEVFYAHSGQWRFMTGEAATDGEVHLSPGDLISIPTRLFRGFENVGDSSGFLWAVLGGDDPGHVLWAPYVFELADEYGLVLLEDGQLVDTRNGELVPPHKRRMQKTTRQQVAALQQADSSALANCVVRSASPRPDGQFAALEGVTHRQLVGSAPLDWAHGFQISEARLSRGSAICSHVLGVPDVWFVHRGLIRGSIDGQSFQCGPGATITVAAGARRTLENAGQEDAEVVLVRGGDAPSPAVWS